MGKCVIFGAAEFDKLLFPLVQDDLVIAADGGLAHLQRLGRRPDVILGDFDSLGYVPAGAEVFPVEKDDTDAMLAVRCGLCRGYREFLFYGCMDGRRLDHTIANFQTLAYLRRQGARGYLVGRRYLAGVFQNEAVRFSPSATGIVSVFCMGTDASGVNIRGLKYGLENGSLCADFPLGVSNRFVGQTGEISVENGTLLVLWDVENGLPTVL